LHDPFSFTPPATDDVNSAKAVYRTLPSTNTLRELDRDSFAKKKDKLWAGFQTRYSEASAEHVRTLPVDTEINRKIAREKIAQMQLPGFKYTTNFPALYTQHLVDNNVSIEPINFFSQEEVCERAPNIFRFANNSNGIQNFVGLSGYDWNQDSPEKFTETLRACAEEESVDAKTVKVAIDRINKWSPKILKQSKLAQAVKDAASEMVNKPKTLETLLNTRGYTLQNINVRNMNISVLNRLFNTPVAPAREEAIENSLQQIEELFSDTDTTEKLSAKFNQCTRPLGRINDNSPDYLKTLNHTCHELASTAFSNLIGDMSEKLDTVTIDDSNYQNYLLPQRNRELESIAHATDLKSTLTNFDEKRLQMAKNAALHYSYILTERFKENTEAADQEVLSGCETYRDDRNLTFLCSSLSRQIVSRGQIRRCDNVIDRLKPDTTLTDDVVVYGDGITQRQVGVRNLLCSSASNGVDLHTQLKSDGIHIKALDQSSSRTIFQSVMTTQNKDDNPTSWTVSSLSNTTENTLYGKINSGQLIQCLLVPSSCL